ncbi:MAG: thioredoxin fold domain-containing protein [Campylobacterota bacterium]
MYRVLIFLFITLCAFANSYEQGKEIFDNKCASCHKGYISFKTLKENFFEKDNKLLNLKVPTVNMLSYAIMESPKKIGNPDDSEMRQIEIEEYLRWYLKNPQERNSVCDDTLLAYYDKKEPMNISQEEAQALSIFFMKYEQNRDKSGDEKKKLISSSGKFNEEAILKKAKQESKLIIVYATSKTCYFCKKMDKEVLQLDDVKEKIDKNYLFYEVNVDLMKLPFDLNKDFKGMTPTFFVLDEKANILNTYPGAWVKKDFLDILKENL